MSCINLTCNWKRGRMFLYWSLFQYIFIIFVINSKTKVLYKFILYQKYNPDHMFCATWKSESLFWCSPWPDWWLLQMLHYYMFLYFCFHCFSSNFRKLVRRSFVARKITLLLTTSASNLHWQKLILIPAGTQLHIKWQIMWFLSDLAALKHFE